MQARVPALDKWGGSSAASVRHLNLGVGRGRYQGVVHVVASHMVVVVVGGNHHRDRTDAENIPLFLSYCCVVR